ncbi:MAG: putative porin [Candidatus Omnitrophica bacterium]|nr:putative porin [Candidatus Omnitrophota bacterium]
MKKFLTSIAAAGFISMIFGLGVANAGEVDLLLQKLVEKGVLTPGEAQQIGTETKEQVKAEIAAGKNTSLPAWIQNTKLKGDFRVRYQLDHSKTSDTGVVSDRNRGRVRLRLGVDSKVNDKIMVGAGIATGTTDVTSYDSARSNNQSFGNAFAKKPLVLDYAYARYTPVSWASIMGGKMKYLPWRPTDVMIDNDITPEGGVLQLTKKLNDKTNLFLDTMLFVLSETEPTTHNAMTYATQGGIEYLLTDTHSLKGAVSYYDFSNVKGRALDGSQGTNTKSSGSGTTGLNKYGFREITPAFELGIKNPFKPIANITGLSMLDIEKLAFFGEYYNNLAAPAKNNGFASGFGFGNEKVDEWGKWQVQYVYSMLEKDSVLDTLPDSDRYSGKTGIRGNKVSFQYGLGKNTWLQLAGFRFENINQIGTNRRAPTTVFQADWNMKF